MRDIYIVLIKAHTGLGSFARFFSGYPYTHIAVSLDSSLTDFVSFSRRYHSFPFDAGFMHEYRDFYAFGKHRCFQAKVFRLPLTELSYRRVEGYIRSCEEGDGLFNLFSMATMSLVHGIPIAGADNCMSFTAKVLELSGCVVMSKPYYKYDIKQMDGLLSEFLYFEGKLRRISSPGYEEYMKPFELKKYLSDMRRLLWGLTVRAVRKDKK